MELFVAFFTLLFFAIIVGIKLAFVSLVALFMFLFLTPYGWACLILYFIFSSNKKNTK